MGVRKLRYPIQSKNGPILSPTKKNQSNAVDRSTLPKIVSLFAGAGGLDLGFKKAGYKIAVAFDISYAAIRSHKKNFPRTESVVADLIELGPIGVLQKVKENIAIGQRIAVIGGPPCQGFSRANSASYADDPRNQLPALYLEIVKELQRNYIVEFLIIENVLGIRDKKHSKIYQALVEGISDIGFNVSENEMCAVDYGVPQYRRRIVLSGMRKGQNYTIVRPQKRVGIATVREAIGTLKKPAYFRRGILPEEIPVHPNHWTMQPKSPRFQNPDDDTGNGRSFKRLKWDDASPTIAFGHREIHVHPSGIRRLSIFEAMLLQGFPREFVLVGNLTEQVEQVSNAVPPPLARSIASAVTRALSRK